MDWHATRRTGAIARREGCPDEINNALLGVQLAFPPRGLSVALAVPDISLILEGREVAGWRRTLMPQVSRQGQTVKESSPIRDMPTVTTRRAPLTSRAAAFRVGRSTPSVS
jgi:hypothetical protein